METPEAVLRVLHTLEAAGHEAWLVGGCVRDPLLGRSPHDYDVATAATPEETCALFPRCVPTGLRYGTVTVLTDGAPGRVEVTTFRADGRYSDGRRPDDVQFSRDIRADLSRRDFTVNAMAFHPARGLFDPFGGRGDLAARRIRTVGDPMRRFSEDALRVLRAFRFSAQLGFEIEPETLRAAQKAAGRVAAVSRERVRDELARMLLSPRPQTVFWLLGCGIPCGLPAPEQPPAAALTARLAAAPADAPARWAGLLRLLKQPEADAARLLRRLKLDNRTIADVRGLLSFLEQPAAQNEAELRRQLARFGPETLRRGMALSRALTPDALPGDAPARLSALLRRGDAYRVSMLQIGGRELGALGLRGPACGRALRALLGRVLDEPALNRPDTLLALAREFAAAGPSGPLATPSGVSEPASGPLGVPRPDAKPSDGRPGGVADENGRAAASPASAHPNPELF